MARARMLLLLALGALAALVRLSLAVNTSPSLPRGLYLRVQPTRPSRPGDLVLFCPPPLLAAFALGRGYLQPGPCPPGVKPLGKLVVAAAGDEVLVEPEGIAINGVAVPRSRPVHDDPAGRWLPAVAPGRYRVPAGQIWVFSPYHPLAWDSRYFGPVPDTAILVHLQPLLVQGGQAAFRRDPVKGTP